ncbi:MAG TPA: septum formation initiator family protein [Acidobacteriota bacterium]|nr:septum formation initiator family protein [Acidobacteriota bacterium]
MKTMAYHRSRVSHKKELYYILCIFVLAVIMGFSFLGPGGYRDLRRAQIQLEEQKVRVEELKRSNNERLQSIEALRHDREAIERYAREKGYGREGEIIQHIPEE